MRLQKSLETFFGLGNQHSTRILAKYSIFHTAKVGSIPSKTIAALTAELSTMKIETDLKRKIKDDILRLRDMDLDCKETQQNRSKVIERLKRRIMYIYKGAIASSALRGISSIVGLDATSISRHFSTVDF
ncbi:S13-like H2TH [Glarea lozoyensis ATCC 20868]|uniref:S13-like H2TH n=1 Tax=Glarea lozoyensis (strain ATCC 20868 / MF5171) TaxID=1116229 RepID=S3E359_GLAL2|nr:S13-like H2TH [Glarea lozoyensis ATCC 20868]EPE32858.1 S13-like H2TH [Glarea lozoyensis ATCC 20868]